MLVADTDEVLMFSLCMIESHLILHANDTRAHLFKITFMISSFMLCVRYGFEFDRLHLQ